MAFSKTIQMYIFDGNPNGRIMCEPSNWNGRIYKVSRNELSVFSQRADAENTGVYFLLGKDENNTDTVYIGEAEKVCTRLKQHLHDADYWSDAIVVISKESFDNGKPIVKRVIATEGQTVDIDFETGDVSVDGTVLQEDYINALTTVDGGVHFPLTVAEGCIFVLGDNRGISKDSRYPDVGQIDKREVLGKAIFLMYPGTDDGTYPREFDRVGAIQ